MLSKNYKFIAFIRLLTAREQTSDFKQAPHSTAGDKGRLINCNVRFFKVLIFMCYIVDFIQPFPVQWCDSRIPVLGQAGAQGTTGHCLGIEYPDKAFVIAA